MHSRKAGRVWWERDKTRFGTKCREGFLIFLQRLLLLHPKECWLPCRSIIVHIKTMMIVVTVRRTFKGMKETDNESKGEERVTKVA